MIEKYDPNIYWKVLTFEITLMQWDYSTKIEAECGGNVNIFDLMESALDSAYDSLIPEDGEVAEVTLTKPDGSTMLCVDDEDEGVDWLKDKIVSIAVIKQEREKL